MNKKYLNTKPGEIHVAPGAEIPAAEIAQQLRWIAANIMDIRFRLDRMAEEAEGIKHQ